jgi:hypothetical protein
MGACTCMLSRPSRHAHAAFRHWLSRTDPVAWVASAMVLTSERVLHPPITPDVRSSVGTVSFFHCH